MSVVVGLKQKTDEPSFKCLAKERALLGLFMNDQEKRREEKLAFGSLPLATITATPVPGTKRSSLQRP